MLLSKFYPIFVFSFFFFSFSSSCSSFCNTYGVIGQKGNPQTRLLGRLQINSKMFRVLARTTFSSPWSVGLYFSNNRNVHTLPVLSRYCGICYPNIVTYSVNFSLKALVSELFSYIFIPSKPLEKKSDSITFLTSLQYRDSTGTIYSF